jgi:hypothetical protein
LDESFSLPQVLVASGQDDTPNTPGTNPTIASYVQCQRCIIYNTKGSLVRLKKRNIFFTLKNALSFYNASVVIIHFKSFCGTNSSIAGANPMIVSYNAANSTFFTTTLALQF